MFSHNLQYIADNQPILAALILGLLIAVNPCQLAICISALSYILRQNNTPLSKSLNQVILFTIGRATTYILLGIILSVTLQKSVISYLESHRTTQFFSIVESVIPYILIAFALFFLYRTFSHEHHSHGESCHNSGNIIHKRANRGAFLLGAILALLFCPESAIIFFGTLIPLSASSHYGIAFVLCFSFAAILPLLLITATIRLTRKSITSLQNKFETIQKYLNVLTAIIFITLAVLILLEQ